MLRDSNEFGNHFNIFCARMVQSAESAWTALYCENKTLPLSPIKDFSIDVVPYLYSEQSEPSKRGSIFGWTNKTRSNLSAAEFNPKQNQVKPLRCRAQP